jgi:hypothetical protein
MSRARPSGQAGQASPRARKRSRPSGDHPSRGALAGLFEILNDEYGNLDARLDWEK